MPNRPPLLSLDVKISTTVIDKTAGTQPTGTNAMSAKPTRFYLDKRNGKFMGVCAGIADYFGWDVTLVRIGFALGTVLGSGSGILAYLVIGWIANPKPSALYDASPDQQAFWRDVRVAPKRTLRDVNAQFRDADRRLRDLEFHLTSESRELANEIEKLR